MWQDISPTSGSAALLVLIRDLKEPGDKHQMDKSEVLAEDYPSSLIYKH